MKRRIERLASTAKTTPHACVVEALRREAERSELPERLAAHAASDERQALASGKAMPQDAAFDDLEARISGAKVRRPRAGSWRGSK